MGRGYLEDGIWKAGKAPNTLQNSPSFSTDKLHPDHRYIMYISYICPFAHSANVARVLKGLEQKIEIVALESAFGEEGWVFGAQKDPLHPEYKFLHQVYTHAKKDFTGRVTVPVLYDVDTDSIVSNESVGCMELFNNFGANSLDLFAPAKNSASAAKFDELKARVLKFNFAVYGAGLATTQNDYEQSANFVFETLDIFENLLSENRFVFGDTASVVDIRLFVTYLRFIYVYRLLFRLDKKNYANYTNLNIHVREFYSGLNLQGTAPNLEDIKAGYFKNFEGEIPQNIVPVGPDFELNAQ
eukprot:Phypoly_transcript_13144.p1 GENE.Phypoly_transcript_13144~~Phypoly_transcript_13144.p1  ORF type:complete len:299 (+),score=54.87 Phypoly_transcript_13144:87-983(+)